MKLSPNPLRAFGAILAAVKVFELEERNSKLKNSPGCNRSLFQIDAESFVEGSPFLHVTPRIALSTDVLSDINTAGASVQSS